MKKVIITLVQGENTLTVDTPIKSNKINVVAGTVAARLLAVMTKAKKYKQKLGFSFARKFDININIDGKEANGTDTILNGIVKFGITVQNNEESVKRFESFISELVSDILTGRNELEGTFKELCQDLDLQLN